jgi:hypothetical protein
MYLFHLRASVATTKKFIIKSHYECSVTRESRSNIFRLVNEIKNLDSVVGIATGYGRGGQGVGARVPVGSTIFSSPRRPERLWGPPNLLSKEYRGLFLRGQKRPGREADH